MAGGTARRATSALAASLVVVALTPAPGSAARARCFGERATIVGTDGGDVIRGTTHRDVIAALGGGDVIRARGGADLVCGGRGDDEILGARGIDLMFGGRGADRIFGQAGGFNLAIPGRGDDHVDLGGAPGDEVIYLDATRGIDGDLGAGTVTGWGHDTIVDAEWLVGTEFDDELTGTEGDDALFGAGGSDVIHALGGIDQLAGGEGDDLLDGGNGFDFADPYFFADYYYGAPPAGPITVDLPTGSATGEGMDELVAIEGHSGSTGNDVMIGDAADNDFVRLYEGDDTVAAGDGSDLVDGGDGADDLDGGAGDDLVGFFESSAGITADLSAGSSSEGDVLAGFEDIVGTFFDDTLTGSSGANDIFGAFGNDSILGLGGDDVLAGQDDMDTADGGGGTDECDAETETACETEPAAIASGGFVSEPARGRSASYAHG